MEHKHAITNTINLLKTITESKNVWNMDEAIDALAGLEVLVEAVPDGMEYAVNHTLILDKDMRKNNVYPPSYKMRVPPDENYCSDLQISKVCNTAKLLNEAMGKGE